MPSTAMTAVKLGAFDYLSKPFDCDRVRGLVQMAAARRLTGSDLPALRADWFVATATRPPLYHTVLDLPGTDAQLDTYKNTLGVKR